MTSSQKEWGARSSSGSTWPLAMMLGPKVSVLGAGCWVLAGRSPGSGTHAGDLALTGRESAGLPLPPKEKSSAPWEVWPRAFVLMFCSLILEGAVETIRSLNFSEARSKYRKEYISQAGRSGELTAFFWMRSEKADL